MPERDVISTPCYAKINLALAVGPPEPPGSAKPGYHPICSLFACVGLCDDLVVQRVDGASTYDLAWADDAPRTSPIDWPLDKDLGVRAHRALEARAGRALPIRLTLRKRIPVGGGLGGGSSNAAGVLRVVRDLFALPLHTDELRGAGATLGSDVPFFVGGAAESQALVEGFGERVTRGRWLAPGAAFVLILPPFGCPTGEVYRAFDALNPLPLRPERAARLLDALARGQARASDYFNDLAVAAEHVSPALRDLRHAIGQSLSRPAHVSGSGSTLFVAAGSGDEARALAARVRQDFPACVAVASAAI